MVSSGTLLNGRYRLDERIASGGMGDVWRGTDEVLGRTVAIKILLSALLEERGFVERFRAEARTMATINHPGVVRIYDFGHDNVAYLIMEYIEGEPLSRTLNRIGRLTPQRTMSLVSQAAEALQAAHEKGVVHRDVKPGNLMVRPNGTLILSDFGIARFAAAGQITATGAVLGTASYLAPEQASGLPASAASDVYSLGIVAYQCLSGHRPFEGSTPLEIAMKHVNGTPRPLPEDVPVPIRQVVERAMAKDPAARWGSAADFAAAARRAASLPRSPVSAPALRTTRSPAPAVGRVRFQRGPTEPPTTLVVGGSVEQPTLPLRVGTALRRLKEKWEAWRDRALATFTRQRPATIATPQKSMDDTAETITMVLHDGTSLSNGPRLSAAAPPQQERTWRATSESPILKRWWWVG